MATPVTGTQITSYELTAGAKVNFDEMIYLISPTDLPMTLGVDSDGSQVVRSMPVDQTIFYWQDEEILTPRVALAALAATADATFTVAAGEALRFATGDVARVVKAANSEVIRITGVSNATITATRAYAGSTATNFAVGDIIVGIGAALDEGSDPSDFRSRDRDVRSNYTEIFGPYKISMSRTEQIVGKYGVSDEWSKQLFNRTRELMIRVEQALLNGINYNDSANRRRLTGGLQNYITTNVDATSTSLTVAALVAQQQACYNRGDVPLVLVANPNSLTELNDTSNTSIVRTTTLETQRGRRRVSVLDTEFGTTTIVRNRWVHPYQAYLIKPEGVIRRTLSPLQYEQLAKSGDSDHAQLVMEEGFEIKGQTHMAMFSNLSTYTRA